MLFFHLSLFLLTPRIKYLFKFSQTLLQSCFSASVVHSITTYLLYLFSSSLIARYYLSYIHHTLRDTWAPCLHPLRLVALKKYYSSPRRSGTKYYLYPYRCTKHHAILFTSIGSPCYSRSPSSLAQK